MKKILLAICAALAYFNGTSQTTYVSNGSSTNWTTATAWTPNGVPTIGSWPYDNVVINHTINYTGSLTNLSSSSFKINSGGTLTVSGNFTNGSWGNPSVRVNSGGTLTVNGTFTNSGADTLINAGTFNVGTWTLNGGAGGPLTNTGTISVTNNMTFNIARTFTTVGGNISVGGALTVGTAASVFSVTTTPITVGGNLNISGSGTFTDLGPSITIGGNFNNTGSVGSTFGGTVSVTGNLNNTGSSNITFNAATTIGGAVTGSGTSSLTAKSSFAVTGAIGLTGGAYINGTGLVTYASFAATGTSYIVCNDGGMFDTDASTPLIPAPGATSLNLGTACTFLPVTLIAFNANKISNAIELTWNTAAEINSSHWILQRSADGVNFIEISKLAAAGNSNQNINYSFTDGKPFNGVNYYRLLQFDNDGTNTFFPVKTVNFKASSNEFQLKMMPTLVETNTELSFTSKTNDLHTIVIFNTYGNIVYQSEMQVKEGENTATLSLDWLNKGCYLAQLKNANETIAQVKFMKK